MGGFFFRLNETNLVFSNSTLYQPTSTDGIHAMKVNVDVNVNVDVDVGVDGIGYKQCFLI
jgi:hypothetical protein